MPARATLDGLTLPVNFSYQPYVPPKRQNSKRTATAVVTQAPALTSIIVHGDGTILWKVEAGCPKEYQQIYDKFVDPNLTEYEFVGYWGEVLTVYFLELDQPNVKSRLFNYGGILQVIAQTTPINMG